MNARLFLASSLLVGLGLAASLALAQVKPSGPVKRAEPPQFSQEVVDKVFFPDITREFKGERPANFGGAAVVKNVPNTSPGGDSSFPPVASGGSAWSKLISAATIEDEIKSIKVQLEKDVTTPSKFAAGDFKKARRHFAELALLFAVAAEYDTDVRFKKDAGNARLLFGRTASNCKVGTEGAYQEARQRKDDLESMLGGSGLPSKPAEATFEWGRVADRSPLMQRLEFAHQNSLQPWTGAAAEFAKNADAAIREAEIIATISELLKQKGMKDADDTEYLKYCDIMKNNAAIIVDAAKSKKYDDARKAVGEINKACTNCHQTYRS